MAYEYVPREYGLFSAQLASLDPEVQLKVFEAIQNRLRYYPTSEKSPVYSKMLKPPLDCIRRIHVGRDYVIAYTVCEECRLIGCDEKLSCFYCFEEPAFRLKLISVGPRATFYKELERNWYTWLNTRAGVSE